MVDIACSVGEPKASEFGGGKTEVAFGDVEVGLLLRIRKVNGGSQRVKLKVSYYCLLVRVDGSVETGAFRAI